MLERVSDAGLDVLALAARLPGPARQLAPKLMDSLAEIVAAEAWRRLGADHGTATFPDFTPAELEAGALVLVSMAEAERESEHPDHELVDALTEAAEALVKLRQLKADEGQGN